MKATIFLVIASLMLSLGAYGKNTKEMKELTLKVEMRCMSCKNKIEKNIAFEKGIKSITADLETETVVIVYRADKNTAQGFVDAITKLGYKAEIISEKVLE